MVKKINVMLGNIDMRKGLSILAKLDVEEIFGVEKFLKTKILKKLNIKYYETRY